MRNVSLLSADSVDEIDDGIHERKREKHNDKTNYGKLECCFRFFYFFTVSESSYIQNSCKYYSSNGKNGTRNDKLIGNFYDFVFHSRFDFIIARNDRTLWSAVRKGSLNGSSILYTIVRTYCKYARKGKNSEISKNEREKYFFHKR